MGVGKLQMGKLTGKGKHTVKVGNYPHINMTSKPAIMSRRENKCRILEMHLKLGDQQLKTILYIYRLSYQVLIVKANQKHKIDIHTKKKKECKHNNKDSHQITREENKTGREEERPAKTDPKQLTKWQYKYTYQ